MHQAAPSNKKGPSTQNEKFPNHRGKVVNSICLPQTLPAGTSRKDPSGDQANLRKKDGNVSS